MRTVCVALLMLMLSACANTRSPPVTYPGPCGSHVECFTVGLQKLEEARTELEKAKEIALSAVPIGAVVAFTGNVDPPGWMFCDGRPLNKNDPKYVALFNAIGTTHGGDANPNFLIPDYRGVFLRGVDAGSGRDPDASSRVIGSYQLDALQVHQHDVSKDLKATGTNGTKDVESGGDKYNSDPPSASLTITIGDPKGARTANETRPKNVSVRWIIKYQ